MSRLVNRDVHPADGALAVISELRRLQKREPTLKSLVHEIVEGGKVYHVVARAGKARRRPSAT